MINFNSIFFTLSFRQKLLANIVLVPSGERGWLHSILETKQTLLQSMQISRALVFTPPSVLSVVPLFTRVKTDNNFE